ncbi:hypothetical protein Vadar_008475 [Vaccinium darrowii]|uniref:Uncharacterized protein n=1 Tax=Vaccinium darrowii TaxID=229202 RepID=A0ACB7Y6B0_9ERIC|nr:hypothetical protein Vadar_008475 [Vaccinium darrowii]
MPPELKSELRSSTTINAAGKLTTKVDHQQVRPRSTTANNHLEKPNSCERPRSVLRLSTTINAIVKPTTKVDHHQHYHRLPPKSSRCRFGSRFCCSSETSPKPYPECSETGAASRHSPRSTLEALPNIHSPELNCKSHPVSPSANAPISLHLAAREIVQKAQRREVLHL